MSYYSDKLPTVVAITGASGSILGFELVKTLLEMEEPVKLIISNQAVPVISEEISLSLSSGEEPKNAILDYLKVSGERELLQCYSNKNLGASTSSGTFLTRGMVIIPCSMATLGKLASGVTDNLIVRSADVTLKERRTLILVPRESPFNQIHLENMLRLNRAGALILPPVLSFYQPSFHSIKGQIHYITGKILDHLGLTQHLMFPRWGEEEQK